MTNPSRIAAVRVPLGNRTYPIYIGSGLLKEAGAYFQRHKISHTVVVISDSTVAKLYHKTLLGSLRSKKFRVFNITIPPGEKQKSFERAEKIFTQLLQWKIERSATIVALGGGVIGDLSGFVAATYQRGIGFVQIPTTLLAQVDSSVGGKVGINHPLAKNMIGAFYQPCFVLADVDLLSTLPQREIVCGLGEIVKYGIILDKKFFEFISQSISDAMSRDRHVLQTMVKRSCELKAYVVSKDERESGLRAKLNFGHTIGHAFEHAGGYSTLKHGEAILYGMIAETQVAYNLKMISSVEKEKIEAVIDSIPLPKLSSIKMNIRSLINTMTLDKKVKDGKIRMVLPQSIGKTTLPLTVEERAIRSSIEYLLKHSLK
ncbi:MAG: 3-dehydroquinate synthase [Bacteroidota bacterium]|nr:3-dehydroquinate synthase [Bacteroidota bacterium]